MGKISYILIILCAIPSLMMANTTQTDSLKQLLCKYKDAEKRCEVYVHLADLNVDVFAVALDYWDKALEEAIECDNVVVIKVALDELVGRLSRIEPKRVEYYIQLARDVLPASENKLFVSYLYSQNVLFRTSHEDVETVIEEELARLKAKDKLTAEEQIEWEFLTAVSMDCALVEAGGYSMVKDAIPYVERTLSLLSVYPEEQRCFFEQLCHNKLSNLYTTISGYTQKVLEEISLMVSAHDVKNQLDLGFERVFLDDFYFKLMVYGKVIYLEDDVSEEEATACYDKLMLLVNNEDRRRSVYDLISLYNRRIRHYDKALSYADSCIAFREKNARVIDLITPYEIKVDIYKDMKQYAKALEALEKCDSLREVSHSEGIKKEMAEMQARFNVYTLQLEKERLSNRNNVVIITVVLILLLFITGWTIYQRLMVKRLKRAQEDLVKSNEEIAVQRNRAAESEKMKTAFLSSMCHEIRTPLNAINGFADLLLDKTIDDKLKEDFPGMIQENIFKLTDLLNTMIELSSLVCSTEKLPISSADIFVICHQEIDLLKEANTKHDVTIKLENEEETCLVWTHPLYLALVLKNLLNNAVKFTDKGEVRLLYHLDIDKKELLITVTDEGIGISPDKQEWVFERFTKVDSFKPGTGLGLYICRIIVTRLGGTIHVDPEYKNGCRMVISLPQG